MLRYVFLELAVTETWQWEISDHRGVFSHQKQCVFESDECFDSVLMNETSSSSTSVKFEAWWVSSTAEVSRTMCYCAVESLIRWYGLAIIHRVALDEILVKFLALPLLEAIGKCSRQIHATQIDARKGTFTHTHDTAQLLGYQPAMVSIWFSNNRRKFIN